MRSRGGARPVVVSAPDKFRGSLSGEQFRAASRQASAQVGWSQEDAPLSDGGEGFGTLLGAGSRRCLAKVSGPLGEAVQAPFWISEDPRPRAVVESQLACGLSLAGGAGANDPLAASTTGVGQLVTAAIEEGAVEVVVGCGGSASTDGGRGALEAMGAFPPGHKSLAARLVVGWDVETTFCEAAEVFAPQKGASTGEVALLRQRLEELARLYAEEGADIAGLVGSGAAGGLAGGLAALGGELVSGFELAASATSLDDRLSGASAVVTGEGRLDWSSLAGKVVGGVARRAASLSLGCLVVTGRADEEPARVLESLGAAVVSLEERYGPAASLSETARLVGEVVAEWLADLDVRPEAP